MSLYEKLVKRNNKFEKETNKILNEFKDKLNNVLNTLMNGIIDVKWKHINYNADIDKFNDKICVHGLISMQNGETLFDPDINERIIINSKNKNSYVKYIRLELNANDLETSSVEDIVNHIKKLYKIDKKLTVEEFQLMDMPSGKKH